MWPGATLEGAAYVGGVDDGAMRAGRQRRHGREGEEGEAHRREGGGDIGKEFSLLITISYIYNT